MHNILASCEKHSVLASCEQQEMTAQGHLQFLGAVLGSSWPNIYFCHQHILLPSGVQTKHNSAGHWLTELMQKEKLCSLSK